MTAPPSGDEHRRSHAGIGLVILAGQQAVEPVHHLLEGLVPGEEPDEDGVAHQGAFHAPPLHGKVDDAAEQRLASAFAGRLGCPHGLDRAALGPDVVRRSRADRLRVLRNY